MKDTYYFPHDYNAIQDPKLMQILTSIGLSGIGMYWIIIEILHQQPDGKISMDEFKNYIRFYASFEGKGEEYITKIEHVLIKCSALVEQNSEVFSNRVNSNKISLNDIREKRSKAGKMSAKSRLQKFENQEVEHVLNTSLTSVEQRKEIKYKKKYIKKSFIPPSKSDVIDYFKSNNYTQESAEKFFEYYSSGDWKDKNGSQVMNWKQKAQSVWFKPENEKKERVLSR